MLSCTTKHEVFTGCLSDQHAFVCFTSVEENIFLPFSRYLFN